ASAPWPCGIVRAPRRHRGARCLRSRTHPQNRAPACRRAPPASRCGGICGRLRIAGHLQCPELQPHRQLTRVARLHRSAPGADPSLPLSYASATALALSFRRSGLRRYKYQQRWKVAPITAPRRSLRLARTGSLVRQLPTAPLIYLDWLRKSTPAGARAKGIKREATKSLRHKRFGRERYRNRSRPLPYLGEPVPERVARCPREGATPLSSVTFAR